jgi:protein arginine N-methyltransferase 1
MLKDRVRTLGYRRAVGSNPMLRDKIVLDVGCGTGILSMFCVQSGAKHVYGIDCSDIIKQARQIVSDNGMSDKITLIQGKAEEVELPVPKVDVIVSEWMGYFLLYESMLDTVLFCRDKWLVPGGAIYPDKAQIVFGMIEDAEYRADKIDFWDNVYGFDYSAIKSLAMLEPLVDVVEAGQMMSDMVPVHDIDIDSVKKEELAWSSEFELVAAHDDTVHALTAHFDVQFTRCPKPFGFSTSPLAEYTHWKQTVFYLDQPLAMRKGDVLGVAVSCKPNAKNPRDLDIAIEYRPPRGLRWTQDYRLR